MFEIISELVTTTPALLLGDAAIRTAEAAIIRAKREPPPQQESGNEVSQAHESRR